MDYKAEVMVNNKIVYSKIYVNYSHPNQIVRLVAKMTKKKFDYYLIFIMNKFAEIWTYAIERTKTGYKAVLIYSDTKSKKEMLLVFSGNITIAELAGGD